MSSRTYRLGYTGAKSELTLSISRNDGPVRSSPFWPADEQIERRGDGAMRRRIGSAPAASPFSPSGSRPATARHAGRTGARLFGTLTAPVTFQSQTFMELISPAAGANVHPRKRSTSIRSRQEEPPEPDYHAVPGSARREGAAEPSGHTQRLRCEEGRDRRDDRPPCPPTALQETVRGNADAFAAGTGAGGGGARGGGALDAEEHRGGAECAWHPDPSRWSVACVECAELDGAYVNESLRNWRACQTAGMRSSASPRQACPASLDRQDAGPHRL